MALFPTSPIPSAMTLSSIFPSEVSYAQDGSRYLRGGGNHRWVLEAGWANSSADEFKPIQAFVDKQYGRYGTFTFAPPELAEPRGTALGSPAVAGASQTGTTLDIDGCTATQATFMKKGDAFTVLGDAKMYMATEDIAVDGAGLATLTFQPALKVSPDDGAALTLHDVVLTVGLGVNDNPHNLHSPVLYDNKLKMMEAI